MLGLVVSGGHTSLYRVASPSELHWLGGTIDDAIGEAFDKAAAILEAGYPGGPAIEQLAADGDPDAYDLPRSLLDRTSLDFSFSGLKTALLYTAFGRPVGRGKQATFERSLADVSDRQRADLAASFQKAAVDAILIKLERTIEQWAGSTPPGSLIAGGGVTANTHLRGRLQRFADRHDLPLALPPISLCVDNAAMIAGLAYHDYVIGRVADLELPARAGRDLQ